MLRLANIFNTCNEIHNLQNLKLFSVVSQLSQTKASFILRLFIANEVLSYNVNWMDNEIDEIFCNMWLYQTTSVDRLHNANNWNMLLMTSSVIYLLLYTYHILI